MPEDRRDPDHLKFIISDTVKETLTTFGFDTSNPIALQQQQAWLRAAVARESDPETKADRDFTRTNRKRCESIGAKAITTVVGLLTAGGVYAVWDGIKAAMKTGGGS